MPSKSKKSNVFWLSLGVFLSFFAVSWVFCLFFRFHGYFGHFISFRGYCGRFGDVLVIFLGFGIFLTFMVHFSHFGSSKGSHFRSFGVFIGFFNILVILVSKIIFFDKRNSFEITKMANIIP